MKVREGGNRVEKRIKRTKPPSNVFRCRLANIERNQRTSRPDSKSGYHSASVQQPQPSHRHSLHHRSNGDDGPGNDESKPASDPVGEKGDCERPEDASRLHRGHDVPGDVGHIGRVESKVSLERLQSGSATDKANVYPYGRL